VAAKRLNAGETPDAVAKSLGTTAIPYSDVIKSTVADPKVADAAFSMPNGQVSGPIKSDLSGFAVVKVTAITPGSTPTLDSMRPQLEAQARTDAASKKAFNGVQAYDAAHQSGANLVDAAKKAGFATISVGPITATGAGITGQPNPDLSPKLLKEAFSLPQGGETDSEDDGQGEYFALRVDKVIAPGMPALADIRVPLTRDYMIHEVLQGLQAKADALAARIKKGETVASVAASLHLPVGSATGVDRAKVEQYRALGEALLGQIFAAKPGDVIDGQTAQGSIMVAHVDSVTPAAPGIAASALAEQGPRLSQQLFQGLNQAERDWARRKVKPTYDIKLAREAIGVSDADLPASSASSQAPGKAP
jgi:peptidyl-prolyl cis-trans isomerase D